MNKGKKKCGNCENYLKFKNAYSICDYFDCRTLSGNSGTDCKYYRRIKFVKYPIMEEAV